jgi:signal transduction histidine kinase
MRCVPDTIAARFALANVLGLVVFEIVWLGFLWFQGAASERTEHMLPARIGDVTQLAETIPPADRSDILSRLDVGIQRTPAAVEPETGPSTYALRWRISAAVADHAIVVGKRIRAGQSSARADAEPVAVRPPAEALLIQVALSDGNWLQFKVSDREFELFPLRRLASASGLFLLIIAVVSIWTARRLAAPISDFGRAAERLGVDSDAPPLAERGPRELRGALRAFNQMQQRLRRFVEHRTQMLAAMSHDLKTPLTRLRLRAEFVEDEEQQRKMLADLDAMSAMIESTLIFARDDSRREPRLLVDLRALVENVCDNAIDAGGKVTFAAPRALNVTCRPTAVLRAIANLLDNAIKYGDSARVDLSREAERVVITIDDAGPGIPAEEHENVFAPFYRLEPSRNPDTGGVGLGLAVARTIMREHGGDVTLSNRPTKGLRVRVELPVLIGDNTKMRSPSTIPGTSAESRLLERRGWKAILAFRATGSH